MTTRLNRKTPTQFLSKESISEAVSYRFNDDCLKHLLKTLKETRFPNRLISTVTALYLIENLYGKDSTDDANLRRITTNIEVLADELYAASSLLKKLQSNPVS